MAYDGTACDSSFLEQITRWSIDYSGDAFDSRPVDKQILMADVGCHSVRAAFGIAEDPTVLEACRHRRAVISIQFDGEDGSVWTIAQINRAGIVLGDSENIRASQIAFGVGQIFGFCGEHGSDKAAIAVGQCEAGCRVCTDCGASFAALVDVIVVACRVIRQQSVVRHFVDDRVRSAFKIATKSVHAQVDACDSQGGPYRSNVAQEQRVAVCFAFVGWAVQGCGDLGEVGGDGGGCGSR